MSGTRALVVGTGGHVDHGKTALVRALTGVDTDRWEEEKERGLTIDLGFARFDAGEDAEVGIVDVPGHEDFVTNMLAGATGIDLLLLVVAADEGPMPQTREHLSIAHLLGVREGVVALTKVDRAEGGEWTRLVRDAVQEELRAVLGHAEWPVLPVSSITGEGLEELRRELTRRSRGVEPRPTGDLLRLPVDRSFSLPGAGTVVTGTVWSGSVRQGQEVRILPGARTSRVRSVEVHGETREGAGAGRRCGLALVGVDPEEVPRGSTVVAGEPWRTVRRVGARLRLLPHARRSVEEGQRVRVYLGTREVMARARLGAVAELARGQEDWAVLDLEEELVPRVGDRFVLRFYSPVRTVGGGKVVELEPPREWRGRVDAWQEIMGGGAETAVRAAVELAGGRGLEVDDLPIVTGQPVSRLPGPGREPPAGVAEAGGRWFSEAAVEGAVRRVASELDRLHREERRARGVSLESLRSSVPERFAEPVVEVALSRLAERGEVVTTGPTVRRPEHRPTLTDEERELVEEIRGRIHSAGLEPPEVSDLPTGAEEGGPELLHDLLDLLVASGELVAVSPDIYLSASNEERLRRRAREVLSGTERADPGDFKEAYGVTRRYLIPYLEYLDRIGLTRRTGDGRVLSDPEAAPPVPETAGKGPSCRPWDGAQST